MFIDHYFHRCISGIAPSHMVSTQLCSRGDSLIDCQHNRPTDEHLGKAKEYLSDHETCLSSFLYFLNHTEGDDILASVVNDFLIQPMCGLAWNNSQNPPVMRAPDVCCRASDVFLSRHLWTTDFQIACTF